MASDRDAPGPDADASGARPRAEFEPVPDPEDEIDQEDFDEKDFGDEASDDSDDGVHTALSPRVEAWRKRSATGAILTGFALGLQQVFEKEREQPSIIMTTSGDPPRDLPVEAEFEHGRPRQSVVNIRPWLLGEQAEQAEPTGPARGAADGAPAADAEAAREAARDDDARPGGARPEDA